MPVLDRGAVADLHPPRSPVDPCRADAESQVDALVAKQRLGPQRQAMDVHLALEKRLRQRRALIGQVLLGGQKDDVALVAFLAQADGGLNACMAGADDDDRGGRHGFNSTLAEGRRPPPPKGRAGRARSTARARSPAAPEGRRLAAR